jgi:hypothetical protein
MSKIIKPTAFKLQMSFKGSLDSIVGIATGYGLDDGGVKNFSSPRRPDGFLSNGYPGGKTAGTWNWPLTSN